jgi:triacylglycerol lipase
MNMLIDRGFDHGEQCHSQYRGDDMNKYFRPLATTALAGALAFTAFGLTACGGDDSPMSDAHADPAPPSKVETPRTPNTVPQDVIDYVRKNGRVVDTTIASVYLPKQQLGDLAGVKKTAGLKYGADPRQFVDVFSPDPKVATPTPVVVFIHGGAFTGGAVSTPGSFQYDNIGKYFARNGYVFVNVEYRLAPDNKWPAGGQDLSSAIAWTDTNIAQYGGDPKKIFVMGHSAGATHAAHYTFDTRIQANGGNDGVIGSILLSPLVSEAALKNTKVYYGDTFTPDMAPLNHINDRKMPVFLGLAQYDPQSFQNDVATLFSALCARDNQCPAIKMAQQHSHISSAYHINTADDTYGSDLLTFVREVSSRQ